MAERFLLRLLLSAIVLGVSAFFAPFMLVLKAFEGVYVTAQITASCLRQTWTQDPRDFTKTRR
jgi:hypothetical protein